jgi:hypothetical protein
LKDVSGTGRLRLDMPKQKDEMELPTLHLAQIELEGSNSCVVVTGQDSREDEAMLHKGDMMTLDVLRSVAVPAGVSSTVWLKAHPKIAERTFYNRRSRLVEKGFVLSVGSEAAPRYIPAPTMEKG